MALYKYGSFLTQHDDAAFDAVHSPGATAPYAGIYRCTGCGYEIGIAESHTLPPQSHHSHSPTKVEWRLCVYAQHKK
ncbi:MAG: hypothetical protein JO231_17850 [Acidobacteria bacterium]|nr:hypothetical protein [Acidobacteriota bacterium]